MRMTPDPAVSDPAYAALLALYQGEAARAAEARQPVPLLEPEPMPDWLARDLALERAAIMEYDAGLPRAKAEAMAKQAHGL